MKLTLAELENLKFLLTLRYNPKNRPAFPHKTLEDFTPTESDPNGIVIEKMLCDAIENKLKDYDSIGVSLSGGVDSSLVLALIRKVFPKKEILTYTMRMYGAADETIRAKYLSKKYNAQNVSVHSFSILENMDYLVNMTDEPRWNTYPGFIAEVCKEVGHDILVTGDGADELFAGYVFRYSKFLNSMWRTEDYLRCHENDWVEDQEQMLQNFNWDEIYPHLYKYFEGSDPLTNCLLADYNGKLLHDFIPTTQAYSRKFGIPIFSPFLTEEIRNYSTHLSNKEKFDGTLGKLQLRKISTRIGLEQHNEKIGMAPNLPKEWKDIGLFCRTALLNPNCKIYHELVNYSWVEKSINSLDDKRIVNKLTQLYALEMWLAC